MDDIDRLITEVQESAIMQARLVERLAGLTDRIGKLEAIYDRINAIEQKCAMRGEQLAQGVKHFASLDVALGSKLDKQNLRWALVGYSIGAAGLTAGALKVLSSLL
jgi:hypothetical protein